MVTHNQIFSVFRMSRFQVMIQGKVASTKSIMMLYTNDVSDRYMVYMCEDTHHCHPL
jgi:hypothetical protein